MNTKILERCITELQKDSPDLSYLRGMLETLMELQPQAQGTILTPKWIADTPSTQREFGNLSGSPLPPVDTSPEGMAVEAALASLGGVQPKLDSLTLERNVNLN